MRLLDRRPELPARPRATARAGRAVFDPLNAAGAGVRYVLDAEASTACGELIRTGAGLFEPDNPLFRMPAETLWLELFEEQVAPPRPKRRLGYLIEGASDGRSGTIVCFSETGDGLSRREPAVIVFDLERKMVCRPGMYRLRHPDMPHLAGLLEHCLLVPVGEGMSGLAAGHAAKSPVLRDLAEGTWYALPLLFAFVALLNSPQLIETRRSDLDRLNRARGRRGRAPLLDHIEVRLSLGEASGGSGALGNALRTAPRLHFVRGHLVRREGMTFWRQAHLRGDGHKAIVSRTIRVTAGRSVREDASAHVRMAVNAR